MKIISDNAVYIQRRDLMQVMQFEKVIPGTFINDLFGGGAFFISNSTLLEFVKFTDPDTIDFIKGLDWVIDYGEVKDMPEEDIMAMCNSLTDEYNSIATEYNELTPHQKRLKQNLTQDCDKKIYKIESLKEFIFFRRGDIPMTIPDEFDLPESYGIKPEERKNIVKRVRSLFNKNKKNQ